MLNRHEKFNYKVEHVGNEQQPVLIVDNFLDKPELLIDYCCEQGQFNSADAMYPGIRAKGPEAYLHAIYQHLRPIINETFNLKDEQVKSIDSSYSMVVTPPAQLKPLQAIPHVDSLNMNELASVYFLCGKNNGGTSLYRHKDTGYEYINSARSKTYMDSMNESTKNKVIERKYMNGSNDYFEQIASYEATFNRFVMYRCTSLHSGNIRDDFDFPTDPRTGRLTLNTFIGCYQTGLNPRSR